LVTVSWKAVLLRMRSASGRSTARTSLPEMRTSPRSNTIRSSATRPEPVVRLTWTSVMRCKPSPLSGMTAGSVRVNIARSFWPSHSSRQRNRGEMSQ
jgi:hypothetical protein